MPDSLRLSVFLIALPALVAAGAAAAHDDSEGPLFVAEDGTDRGDCLDQRFPCASVGYALAVAGKGAEIRVAAGTYAVESPEELFLVAGGLNDVMGGFERGTFRADPKGVSTLTGVPSEYRELLQGRGFNIVPDRKAVDHRDVAAAEKLMALHGKLKAGATTATCDGGMAGDLECESVDLLGHFAFADVSAPVDAATDIWGFVDLNSGREYALISYDVGTAVIDVTDPANPAEVGFIDGQQASWRDVKAYQFFDTALDRWQAYAYVTTDGSTDGLLVIDLGGLPHAIRKVDHESDFFSAHNVYATGTDHSTGIALTDSPPLLAISGSNIGDGRHRGYSLADPANPAFVADASINGYMHDASSMIVTDERKDQQCANGGNWCEILFDFNEQEMNVWDITDPVDPQRLASVTYPGVGYVHSGWRSEDRRHVFVQDEADEQQGLNTTLRVFSLADLRSPVLVGSWTGPTRAIDHNGFVRGNRYYMSNYSRGLTVLDISDPTEPVTVGRLDTFPFSDDTGFVGAWGAYPFYFSDTIAISDMDSGLYLARDRSVEVPEGRFSFSAPSFAADEAQTVSLTVERNGGATGSVAVDFETLPATADNDDHLPPSGALQWADGDASGRTIEIPLADDGAEEDLERFFVRLVNPQGNATLGEHDVASVYIGDPGAASGIGFLSDSVETAERGFAHAVLVLRRKGSATGPASVDYAVTGGDATPGNDFEGSVSGTVEWAAGDGGPRNVVFRIVDDGSAEDTEFFEVTLSNASGADLSGNATATVNIIDANTAPNAMAGSSQTVNPGASVTLDGSQSTDPDGDVLAFQWTQIDGPTVSLAGADTDTAEFTAPSVDSDTMLRFRLTVTDPSGLGDTATAEVTVTAADGGGGSGGSGGGAAGGLVILCALALAMAIRRKGVA